MNFAASRQLDEHFEMYHGQQKPENAQAFLNGLLQARWNALIPKFHVMLATCSDST